MPKDSAIKHFRSTTAGATPGGGTMQPGELAINLADKKLYCGDITGTSHFELTRRADSSSVNSNNLRVQLADTGGYLTGTASVVYDSVSNTLGGGCNGQFGSITLSSSGVNRIISGDGNSVRTVSIVQASGGDVALGDAILANNTGVGVKVSESTFSTTVYGDLFLEPDPNANTLGAVNAMGGFNLVPDLLGSVAADLRFYEASANGSNYVGFKAPSIIAANKIWTLPSADGTNGQVLSTNGSATLSWVSNTLAAGSDTQVQFNDGGTNLGGDAGLTYNKTTDTLTIAGDLAVNGGDITCSATTFNLLNSTVTTLNMGGAATAIAIGASTGTTTFANTIKAPVGTATLAPILMQSGTNLTSATAGAIEYDGKCFYATTAGGRTLLSGEHYAMVSATRTISNVNTAQAVFDSANDQITLAANTTYVFEGFYRIISGTTTHTTNMGFAEVSVGTVGAWYWLAVNHGAAAGTVSRAQDTTVFTSAAGGATNATSTGALTTIWFRGVVETSTDGVGVTPQITFSAAPGGTNQIGVGSFIRFTPIGSDTVQSIGPWT